MEPSRPIAVPPWITILLIALFVLSVFWLNYGNLLGRPPLWEIVVNTILLSIPTGLLFFSIWVLVLAGQQRRLQGSISGRPAAFIYWTPRLAGVLITLFITLFSFDVFEGNAPIWEKLLGFVIHSIPSIVLAIAVFLAWRRDRLGFWLFTLAAAAFFMLAIRGVLENPLMGSSMLLVFALPLALIAAMYWANRKWRSNVP